MTPGIITDTVQAALEAQDQNRRGVSELPPLILCAYMLRLEATIDVFRDCAGKHAEQQDDRNRDFMLNQANETESHLIECTQMFLRKLGTANASRQTAESNPAGGKES